MKKLILLCCLLTPLPVLAQTPPVAPGSGGFAGPGPGPGNGPKFEEFKARHIQHLQEELACVQAAQTIEAMKACRPKRPPGAPGGGGEAGGPSQGAPNAWHPSGQ